jgi:hypothetical protein
MAGESEEVKFSLGGKCEQRPWLVLKMPVGRQAKHETCVGGMAMVLYSDQCPNSELADGTSTVVAVFFPRARVAGPESRHQQSSLFWLTGQLVSYRPVQRIRTECPHENESDLPLAYRVVLY